MTTFALHTALGVELERSEEMSGELHDALHTSDSSMQTVSQHLAETYDPASLLMGSFLGLAILMNEMRAVPQGYKIDLDTLRIYPDPNFDPDGFDSHIFNPPAPPDPPDPSSAYPPERWVCPECSAIIEEVVYATLPRMRVQGEHGEHTEIKCPVCNHQTIGMAWMVVEVAGTEGKS